MKAEDGWYYLVKRRRLRIAYCPLKEWVTRGAWRRAWFFSFRLRHEWSSVLEAITDRWQISIFGLNIAHVYRICDLSDE